nr:MAG TPA: hypothetical protein [Caudoviricetes sp.]
MGSVQKCFLVVYIIGAKKNRLLFFYFLNGL